MFRYSWLHDSFDEKKWGMVTLLDRILITFHPPQDFHSLENSDFGSLLNFLIFASLVDVLSEVLSY